MSIKQQATSNKQVSGFRLQAAVAVVAFAVITITLG